MIEVNGTNYDFSYHVVEEGRYVAEVIDVQQKSRKKAPPYFIAIFALLEKTVDGILIPYIISPITDPIKVERLNKLVRNLGMNAIKIPGELSSMIGKKCIINVIKREFKGEKSNLAIYTLPIKK